MSNSKGIAAIVGPTIVAMVVSEFPLVQPHLYDTQIPPLVYLSGVLMFVGGLAIVRAHNQWTRDWTVLVTLSGWFGLVLGLVRMFAAGQYQQGAANTSATTFMILEAILLVGGLVMTFKAYTRDENRRRPADPPPVIARDGWQYHHLGIPHAARHGDEQHLGDLGVYVRGFETSPYGIEWMRFERHCEVPEVVRTVPHVAFVVPNLAEALRGRQILIAPNQPSPGVRVAFILDDGAPVELLEFGEGVSDGRRPGTVQPTTGD